MTSTHEGLTPAELRELFLFADLDDAQLAWVAENGDVVAVPAGTDVSVEGEPAECFFVLLEGTMTMVRVVGGSEVETVRTAHRGVYSGAVQFYFGDRLEQRYPATVRAVTGCRFLALPAGPFAEVFRRWYPMAVHLLEGLFIGQRNSAELVGQRERLLAMGKLTAGLTHELNNPAAAAARATDALRERFAGMRHKLAMLAGGAFDGAMLRALTGLQEEFVARIPGARDLPALERSDLEGALEDWLADHDVARPWELATVFVAAGLGPADLDRVPEAVAASSVEPALRWLGYTVETESLLLEITDSTRRISNLVDAAKQYSQMDRTPHQPTDLHDGLDATLVMLGGKIGPGVTVVKEYDRGLPEVPAYAGELNQVWTNLIANALEAMEGAGTLTLRTARDGDCALVEVGDTGPGIPPELRARVFEPFFTTKPVGQGTGLGLDVSWRVVVKRHGGDLRVVSEPGDTRFQVLLPLSEPAA
ncbi:cyclic nucleotide-binding domain-containing protein [Blastococcus sp. TML/M2B]|uniref:ATP-binding protein n=1 Tax=unclassified Blastococcus TaxID=2619396 RepID=UPI001909D14A|nr:MULTISPECIES: ATP-binding protein [unclassified Blastococcus]MBN1092953.1 cyclic nucleotide-binding domain-containing protein [Blastococcus sp. TML/M2B]MBN1096941.1 cyclic nucleotide-binding domain-containing protein [Blastococcus sp. TML/C7B]